MLNESTLHRKNTSLTYFFGYQVDLQSVALCYPFISLPILAEMEKEKVILVQREVLLAVYFFI